MKNKLNKLVEKKAIITLTLKETATIKGGKSRPPKTGCFIGSNR